MEKFMGGFPESSQMNSYEGNLYFEFINNTNLSYRGIRIQVNGKEYYLDYLAPFGKHTFLEEPVFLKNTNLNFPFFNELMKVNITSDNKEFEFDYNFINKNNPILFDSDKGIYIETSGMGAGIRDELIQQLDLDEVTEELILPLSGDVSRQLIPSTNDIQEYLRLEIITEHQRDVEIEISILNSDKKIVSNKTIFISEIVNILMQ
jgi:hypothetical protein